MKTALLSDIHGNSIALDAVLRDAHESGIDSYVIIGDLVAIGHDPVGVLERLGKLPNAIVLRGNTDRYIVEETGPPPTVEDAEKDSTLVGLAVDIARSFAWTHGYLTAAGWLDWLGQLPLEHWVELPRGKKLLCVHASPGCDDGGGIHPGTSDRELKALLSGCIADIICVGHTHQPMVRMVDGKTIINLGSVSNPLAPDLRASYVLLQTCDDRYELLHRRVPYDHQTVMKQVEQSGHPAREYINRFQQGLMPVTEPHPDHLRSEAQDSISKADQASELRGESA